MGTTVEGNDVRDVQRQVFAGERRAWIEIRPRGGCRDYLAPGADEFEVYCSETNNGNFTKTMPFKEAKVVVVALLREQYQRFLKFQRQYEARARTEALQRRRLALKEAKRTLAAAKKRLKLVKEGGDVHGQAQEGSRKR